eukprot:CAMPEP_0201591616 /NCGR_PEP_ID=MMETSP0190_2-20130828/189737_1 /ASSEMBLY_ACC=CAM_ASM_000263 /TAXON_ID=37353 /ORGANISM="Rosalina sp." /LENGTH=201 /DNA_ID=CAMNT_0048050017 /DNA_START=137 /DNA_END=739 /DNA_ORIENTATION=-
MVREIISLGVGQCGIQLGHQTWQQYNAEHHIQPDGKYHYMQKSGPSSNSVALRDTSFLCFYEETGAGQFVPRNLFVDLEPNVVDDVLQSKYKEMYPKEFCLKGKEDAANNFARGHYTIGKEMIDKVNDRLRKLVDSCDNLQGFIINHSVAGGTGSGLGALMLERMAVDYRKKTKLGFEVYPSPNLSTCVVDPYNSLLTTHW